MARVGFVVRVEHAEPHVVLLRSTVPHSLVVVTELSVAISDIVLFMAVWFIDRRLGAIELWKTCTEAKLVSIDQPS